MLRRAFMHRCTPYCKPEHDEHTEVVYTDAHSTGETIRQSLRAMDGRNVVRAEEEPDAPLPNEPKDLAKAWLVTWRDTD
jgi:hypothetical protein